MCYNLFGDSMKKINHIGSYGLVIENNRILLIKKVGGPYDGKLDLPGGTIEENETSEEALIRELEEETGIKPIDYYLFDEDSVTIRWMHKGEEEEICHKGFFYIVNKYEGTINNNIEITKITPLIHGGKSTTIYRSGTPVTANVIATGKALDIAIKSYKRRTKKLTKLNKYLRKELSKLKYVHINSSENSIPNTLNFSLIDKDTKSIINKLNKKEIYVSTTTACSLEDTPSKSVLAITNDINLAKNTIRISISHITTKEELTTFIKVFKKITR